MSSAGTFNTALTTRSGLARHLRLVTDPSDSTAPKVSQCAPPSADVSRQSFAWSGAGSHISKWMYPAAHASAPSGIPSGTYGTEGSGAVELLASCTTFVGHDRESARLPGSIPVVARTGSNS